MHDVSVKNIVNDVCLCVFACVCCIRLEVCRWAIYLISSNECNEIKYMCVVLGVCWWAMYLKSSYVMNIMELNVCVLY